MIVNKLLWPAPTSVRSQHTDSDRLQLHQLIGALEKVKLSVVREQQPDIYVTGCSGIVVRLDRAQTEMEVAQARLALFGQMREEALAGRLTQERAAYYEEKYKELA